MQEVVLSSCELTNNSLTIPSETPFDEWQQIGGRLKEIEGAVMWWIGDWLNFGERNYGEKYAQALDATAYEYGTLRQAKWVAGQCEMSIRIDNLTWTHHVVALGADNPQSALKWAEEKGATVRELREYIRDEKQGILPPPELPDGKYNLIYADPPWRYEFSETNSRKIENQYPTMTVEEICALDVPAADNAVLYLWATAPKLPEALQVMDAWGFEYKTHAIWDKEKIGMGYWFRGQHELLMVGTKGNFSPPNKSDRVGSVFREAKTLHSKKPKAIQTMIHDWFPRAKRFEMFCRSPQPDWHSWGNQVDAA